MRADANLSLEARSTREPWQAAARGWASPPRLPGRGEEIARLQETAGRTGLTDAERERLAAWYEEVVDDPFVDDAEVVWLLTRPFSRRDNIPAYYRYVNLHVYHWFLGHYEEFPLAAGLLAIRASLLNLAAQERAEVKRWHHPPPYIAERLRRVDALLPRVDGAGANLASPVEHDRVLDHRLSLLARCTDLPQSADHNEHLFLCSVQTCELVFYLVRWVTWHVTHSVGSHDRVLAACWLGLLSRTVDLLNGVFWVLGTLSAEQFLEFRAATGSASAVHSLNFHLMEIAIYGYDPRKAQVFQEFSHLTALNEPPYTTHRPLGEVVRGASDPRLETLFAHAERSLLVWRSRHYSFGRRYLPADINGSGGTEGAAYLKKFVRKHVTGDSTATAADDWLLEFAWR